MIILKPTYYSPNITSSNHTGWVVDLTTLSKHQRENETCIELNESQYRAGIKIINWG